MAVALWALVVATTVLADDSAVAPEDSWRVPDTTNEEQRYSYLRFVMENSPKLAPVEIEGKGMGFLVTRNITEGEPVSVMDSRLIMTSFDSFPLETLVKDAPNQVKLMVRLLYEKFMAEPNHFYSSYVRSMMPNEVHCYHNWTDWEKDVFNKFRVFDLNIEDDISIYGSYNSWNGVVAAKGEGLGVPEEMLKLEAWKWAYCTTKSRYLPIAKEHWR
jgi:hypothetical protein